jgi:hypothetical protein
MDERQLKQLDDEIIYEGYSRNQLKVAFEKVQNKDNWKNPINSNINKNKKDVIEKAIIFFTGSVPKFESNLNGLSVKADGYYIAIGA